MPNSATLYRAAMLPGNDLGNAIAETQMPNGRGTPLILSLPSNNSLANKRFAMAVAGRVDATINTTFTLNVYFGFSTTIASNTQIFNCGAITVNTQNTNFNLRIEFYWDNVSNTITGSGQGFMANSPIGPATLVNIITNVDPNRDSNTFLASGTTYAFTLTGQFGNTSAGNHASVNIFDLETL